MREPETPPTQDEAERMVDEMVGREYAGWRRSEARRRFIAPVTARNAELRREQAAAERAETDRAETARQVAKAWRALYGRAIARQLEPFAPYWILEAEGRRFAFRDRDAASAAARALDGFRVAIVGEGGRRLRGGEPDASQADARSRPRLRADVDRWVPRSNLAGVR